MIDKDMLKHFYGWSDSVIIIFVGDSEQLPPVDEDSGISPVFQKAVHKAVHMGAVSLTEVMRQAKDSPILGHATAVRLGQSTKEFEKSIESEGGFLCHLDVTGNPNEVKSLLWRFFSSEQFRRNTDYAKVITWRRETEEKWNNLFRKMLYMKDHAVEVNGERFLPRVVVGERLQLRAPWIQRGPAGDEIVFPNSAELLVLEIKELVAQAHGRHFHFWRTKVEYLDPNNQQTRTSHIDVLHNTHVGDMLKLIDDLRKNAETLYKANNPKDANSVWGQKIRMETMFADITYPFAGTAHRAQGSTYGYGIVAKYDGDDMLSPKMLSANPNMRRLYKTWLYVALSRAKFGNIIIHK
jgi:ATP-dependent exoDNAse (exonuclease V) alpha subunit